MRLDGLLAHHEPRRDLGDHANRVEEVLGADVLEQEAAGPGDQGLVDVLVRSKVGLRLQQRAEPRAPGVGLLVACAYAAAALAAGIWLVARRDA